MRIARDGLLRIVGDGHPVQGDPRRRDSVGRTLHAGREPLRDLTPESLVLAGLRELGRALRLRRFGEQLSLLVFVAIVWLPPCVVTDPPTASRGSGQAVISGAALQSAQTTSPVVIVKMSPDTGTCVRSPSE